MGLVPRQESGLKRPRVRGWSRTGTMDVDGTFELQRGRQRNRDVGKRKEMASGLMRPLRS